MKKIRFIINPHSGIGKKEMLPELIQSSIDKTIFNAEVCFTKAPGHATELSREAVENDYDIVVAVGGDGSVNETASALINSKTALGIIPTGSGNGLARHLGIPVHSGKAIAVLNSGKIDVIDSLLANDRFCIGTLGVGFDAHIAHLFSRTKKRGYFTYIKLVLKEFASFKEKKFSFLIDGKHFERDCFMLTFANSSQFGNDAVIAPFADLKDGIIDVSIMKGFPVKAVPVIIYRLLHHSIHFSKYFESQRGGDIVIKNRGYLAGHIDGEPVYFDGDLKLKMNSLSIKIIVPANK